MVRISGFSVVLGLIIVAANGCANTSADESPGWSGTQQAHTPPTHEGEDIPEPGGTDPGPTTHCTPFLEATNLLQAPLEHSLAAAGEIAVDNHYVYIVFNNSILRVPKSGGVAETIYEGQVAAGLIAAAGDTVAWTAGSIGQTQNLMVMNADGVQPVALPSEVTLPFPQLLVDGPSGELLFEVMLPSVTRMQTWRWDPADGTAAEMVGVGMPDLETSTNLYFADEGQIVWSMDGPKGGLFITDLSTGVARQLAPQGTGFGSLIGFDRSNIYGIGSGCPHGGCTYTVSALPRDGGPPFVAYQTSGNEWTVALRADESGLYWTDWGKEQGIYYAKLEAGSPTKQLVRFDSEPGSLVPSRFAMDACNLYWFITDSVRRPRIMALAKPSVML
jgi:hypothetical protein